MMKYLLEEGIKHGESSFPVCLYNVDHTFEYDQILPCHWHEEYEIIYLSRGAAIFHIDDCSYSVNEGQFLFINSGELHSAHKIFSSGCCYHAIVFNLSFLNSLSGDSCQLRYINPFMLKERVFANCIPKGTPAEKNIQPLILQTMEKLSQKNTGYELFVKGSLLMIFSIMAENVLLAEKKENSVNTRKNRAVKIKKVVGFIADNYSKKITIDALAALIGMNRYNFCRFFKEYTKMTPMDFINLYRINEASSFLREGSCNVTEAALQTGFENMSYFAKMFKKYKGISPSALKRSSQ